MKIILIEKQINSTQDEIKSIEFIKSTK